MCKTSFPSTARLLERKSHCRKNSPSDLARHWPGWGADATLPIGGSTARVAPLFPPSTNCASLPPRVPSPRSVSLARPFLSRVRLPAPLSLHAHHGNTSVTLSPPCRCPSLSLRSMVPSPSRSVSLPRSPYLSHSIAASSVSLPRLAVSLSSLPRCPCLSPLIAPIYLPCIYLSFFPPSRSLSLTSAPPRPSRSRSGPRNSVEHTRRRAFDTLCSVSEGSVRRFRGEAPFSTNGGATLLSFSLARRHALAPCPSA